MQIYSHPCNVKDLPSFLCAVQKAYLKLSKVICWAKWCRLVKIILSRICHRVAPRYFTDSTCDWAAFWTIFIFTVQDKNLFSHHNDLGKHRRTLHQGNTFSCTDTCLSRNVCNSSCRSCVMDSTVLDFTFLRLPLSGPSWLIMSGTMRSYW